MPNRTCNAYGGCNSASPHRPVAPLLACLLSSCPVHPHVAQPRRLNSCLVELAALLWRWGAGRGGRRSAWVWQPSSTHLTLPALPQQPGRQQLNASPHILPPHLQGVQKRDLPVWPSNGQNDAWQACPGPHINQPGDPCCCRCCLAIQFATPCCCCMGSCRRLLGWLAGAAAPLPIRFCRRGPLLLGCRRLPPHSGRLLLLRQAAVQRRQKGQAVVHMPLVSLSTVPHGCGRRSGGEWGAVWQAAAAKQQCTRGSRHNQWYAATTISTTDAFR